MNEEMKNLLEKIIQINDDTIKQIFYLINTKFIVIQKVINFSIFGNNKQQSELKTAKNISQYYPINNEIINCEKNFSEASNSYQKESNKIKTITDNIEKSLINNRSIKIKKHIYDLQSNNEIKVFKNKKIVYVNKKLLNSYSISRSIKKFGKNNFIIRKNRSSKYRGVSRNGNKWQVLIMINNKNCYLGNYSSEDLAARVYDFQAIKSRGLKAKTNFAYNKDQIKKIYNKEINISDIMAQLNN